MANKVVFRQGTKASYLALQTKDDSTLYFCTDTRELFRGAELYTGGVRFVADYEHLPAFAVAADGVIYICLDTSVGYVLNAARNAWTQAFAAAEYSLVKDQTSNEYAAVYHLTKDGVNTGAAINIPKDMVVSSGTVETKTTSGTWGAAGTYLHLVLANAASSDIYINVGDLIEYVTSGSTAGDMIVVAVSADHRVTATITDGTVTLAKLHADVQAEINKAHTHSNKTVLDGITAEKVAAWDAAEQNAKDYADSLVEWGNFTP